MSEFFESPPSRAVDLESRYRMPPWMGPPEGTLGTIVPVGCVLARTDRVAVCLAGVVVYPAGFELAIVTMSAGQDDEPDPMLMHMHHRARREGKGTAAELLRVGVQFSDGRKATNIDGAFHGDEPPAGAVMFPRGGGGGGGRWEQEFWVWPLPPPGPLVVVCQWPVHGIELTRHELDGAALLDAGAQAQVLFSDEHLPAWPGESESGTIVTTPVTTTRSPPPPSADG